ncbi:hypothetical protein D3C75_1173590 [compost metagenome]
MNHHNRARHTTLTCRTKGSRNDIFDRIVQLRIRQHNRVILSACQCLNPLPLRRPCLIYIFRNRLRTHERNRLHFIMLQQPIHNLVRPMYHIQYTWRKARFGK